VNQEWQESGEEHSTNAQRRLLNATCNDLARQLRWHGCYLRKDGWRHLISGTVLGFQSLPAWDFGDGRQGIIMLGGSSLDLTKSQCTDAITLLFILGDDPSTQGMDCKPVKWSPLIKAARGIRDSEEQM